MVLGDFINRGLMMILGYAYPAFECFKTVERNKADINELRFWCQYWMILAAIAVVERFLEFFIWWLPFYGEMRVVFIVYLWYPKIRGTTYVYEGLFKPLVGKHEADIDQKIQELKVRAWDMFLYYWQNFAHIGQAAFVNMMQYMLTQSYKMKHTATSQESSPLGDFTQKSTSRRGSAQTEMNQMPDSPGGSSPKRDKSNPGPLGSIKLRKVAKPNQ